MEKTNREFAKYAESDLPKNQNPMSAKTVEFSYDIGQSVMIVDIVDIDRPAMVTGLLRDQEGCQYRVVFWESGCRKSEWVFEREIKQR